MLRNWSLQRPNPLATLIVSLYPTGEEGAVYEGDFVSGYQDSAGRIAIGAADDPVGLRLDKRVARVVHSTDLNAATPIAYTGSGASTFAIANNVVTITAAAANDSASFSSSTGFFAAAEYPRCEAFVTVTGSGGVLDLYAGSSPVTVTTSATPTQYILSTVGAANGLLLFRANTAGMSAVITVNSITGYAGNHATQAAGASRPLHKLIGSNYADQFDGVDDSLSSIAGGGGTTGFFWCGAVKVLGGAGSSRSVWSDTGTNTGYRVRIASTNKLAIGAGDGVGFTSATTTDAVDVGNTYVLTVWDDGVNLNAQVNLGTVVSVARPIVTAGTAGYARAKENGAATLFANIAIFLEFYKKNGNVSATLRLAAQRQCAAKAGISI